MCPGKCICKSGYFIDYKTSPRDELSQKLQKPAQLAWLNYIQILLEVTKNAK